MVVDTLDLDARLDDVAGRYAVLSRQLSAGRWLINQGKLVMPTAKSNELALVPSVVCDVL